jgi:hypothetical protein
MNWINNPFIWMAILNCTTGAFSAIAGLSKTGASQPVADSSQGKELLDTSNPWLYVVGGLFTIIVGIGNWFQLPIATYGTIVMIAGSFYNAWFGAANRDWRFWTLNAYVLVLASLVAWSFSFKQPA